MIVMAESTKDNIPMHSGRCFPHPQAMPFKPDPQLGLTPERSPLQACSKKTVRFTSPDKVRARRKVEMVSKENCGLADVELPSRSVKESTSKPSGKRRQQKQAKSSSKVYAERHREREDNHLGTPELHTTLNVGRDILRLQTMNIDIVEAVKHRLAVSQPDRNLVKQKTFAKLNERPKSPSAFTQAISVNVPEEVVIKKSEQQLSKAVKPFPAKPKPSAEKPTLMKLFKPELAFHRFVSTDQHGYQPRALTLPTPKIDQAVFEHQQRISLWETKY
ncbi:hypothetical protein EB796_006006 [Bugula neritina]|uniref:Protein phosphatase 1 regulatory subunit 35 C-terminal domain-containing protein n=1 Tax=Bugula neritina TaxID=10212 RepID=A0A7J7KAJ3_BUGNE|nr:hypothetical protein EB796_006006 [Bugula neritina]